MKALKCLFVGFVILSIAMFAVTGAEATQPNPDPGHIKVLSADQIEVYPRCLHVPFPPKDGEYRDITNVQWAVNNVAEPGTVILKTTDPDNQEIKAFYFGEGDNAGTVLISKDVTIKGETVAPGTVVNLPKGNSLTVNSLSLPDQTALTPGSVIYGGRNPFTMQEQHSLTIESLRFEGSVYSSIFIDACGSNGVVIKKNVIVNCEPALEPLGQESLDVSGILIVGVDEAWGAPGISGPIEIDSNVIDVHGTNPPPSDINQAWCISVNGIKNTDPAVPEDLDITNNMLSNAAQSAIYLKSPVGGTTTITGNEIHQQAYPGIAYAIGVGIDLIHIYPFLGTLQAANISGNKMYGVGVGISLYQVIDSEIIGNTIDKILLDGDIVKEHPDYGDVYSNGITMADSSNCILQANIIKGEGAWAIFFVGPEPGEPGPGSNNNTINIGMNDLKDYEPKIQGTAVLFLWGTAGNTITYPDNLYVFDLFGTNTLIQYPYIP